MSQLKKAYLLKDGEVLIQFVGDPRTMCSDPTLLFTPSLRKIKAFPNQTYDEGQIAAISEALEEAGNLRGDRKPKIEMYGKYDDFYDVPKIVTRVTFPLQFVNKLKNVLADAKISIRGAYQVVQKRKNRSDRHGSVQKSWEPVEIRSDEFSVEGIQLKEDATYEIFNGIERMSELYKLRRLKHAQLNFYILIEWQDFGMNSEECERNILGKLFQDKLLVDCIIVVSKTKEFECHRNILAAHSDVLHANLESGMKESKTHRIEINDVSADAVKLMLDFMYCRKLDLEHFSVDVVVDLLKTAHKYNIGQLEKFTTQFLSRQPTDWFTVNGALELYLFTVNVDNLHNLSGKLRTIMRANPQQLSSCFTFLSWMHKNPKAAAEFSLMLLEPEPMNPLDSPNSSPRSPPYSPCTIYSSNFDPDSD